jgi:peroxiredoxin
MSAKSTLVSGILSPLLAAVLGSGTYVALTRASADREHDFVFRLSMTALAMTAPFWLTLGLAFRDRRRSALGTASRIGLGLAFASLALAWVPVRGAIVRSKQAAALGLAGVEAPGFATVDLQGNTHRLSDHRGKVVLLNVWATWCPPCKAEMPKLDRLFRERRERGLQVFGLSTEDAATQRRFVEEVVGVSYPLLTTEGEVPGLYRATVRYPASFLVDRAGRLQPAPGPDQPFEGLAAKVDALLAAGE